MSPIARVRSGTVPFFPLAGILAILSSGCAHHAGTTNGDDRTMNDTVELSDLVGRWSGDNHLYVMPGDPVRESESEATVSLAADGAVALVTYTWAYEGTPQEGVLMLRTGTPDDVAVVFVDSWHTRDQIMQFRVDPEHEGLIAVRGSYAAPPGPDWGWRITVEADGPDAFRIVMHNVTPKGQEALAVDARFTRVE